MTDNIHTLQPVCETPDCRNVATYSVQLKGKVSRVTYQLCTDCARQTLHVLASVGTLTIKSLTK